MPQQTFDINVGANDQYVYKRTVATWPPTGSVLRDTTFEAMYAEKDYNAGRNDFTIINPLLKWDTSSLPDGAIITGATLRIWVSLKSDANSKSLTAGWYAWDGTSDTDYSEAAETNAHTGTALSAITTATTNDFALTNAAANISTTGTTSLRLHLSDGAQPTGDNYVEIQASEHPATNPPQLIVNYTDPAGQGRITFVPSSSVG